jgi:hypothetical protein
MKLAISSWLATSPGSHVLLFVNRTAFDPSGRLPDELDRLFGPGRVVYGGPIKHDMSDVPYIDDWFRQGIRHSNSTYVCFINLDIILSGRWLGRAREVYRAAGDRPIVVIGQRIDFDLNLDLYGKLSFEQHSLLRKIDEMVDKSAHSDHSPYGVDTFLFRTDRMPFEKIPPFIMGRYNWDNWIIGYLNCIYQTVTFNLSPRSTTSNTRGTISIQRTTRSPSTITPRRRIWTTSDRTSTQPGKEVYQLLTGPPISRISRQIPERVRTFLQSSSGISNGEIKK